MNFVYLVLNFCVLIIKSQYTTVEPLYNGYLGYMQLCFTIYGTEESGHRREVETRVYV